MLLCWQGVEMGAFDDLPEVEGNGYVLGRHREVMEHLVLE